MEKCLGLLTGKKRLPGFNGEWRTKKLGQLLKTPVTDGPHLTPKFVPDGIRFCRSTILSTTALTSLV